MASLINLNINVENLPKEKFVKGKKGVYYNFTISVNDDTNQFGQNVSAFDSQTKEEKRKLKSQSNTSEMVVYYGLMASPLKHSKKLNHKTTTTM